MHRRVRAALSGQGTVFTVRLSLFMIFRAPVPQEAAVGGPENDPDPPRELFLFHIVYEDPVIQMPLPDDRTFLRGRSARFRRYPAAVAQVTRIQKKYLSPDPGCVTIRSGSASGKAGRMRT